MARTARCLYTIGICSAAAVSDISPALASVSVVLLVTVEELARTLVELAQLSSPRVRVASAFGCS